MRTTKEEMVALQNLIENLVKKDSGVSRREIIIATKKPVGTVDRAIKNLTFSRKLRFEIQSRSGNAGCLSNHGYYTREVRRNVKVYFTDS